jgi:hypothetical protein
MRKYFEISKTERLYIDIHPLVAKASDYKDYILFIGVIFHELAHFVMSSLFSLEVTDYSLFRVRSKENVGFVEFTGMVTYQKIILVNLAPFIFNFTIGVLLAFILKDILFELSPIGIIVTYTIFAMLAKSIPSPHDIDQIITFSEKKGINGVSIILFSGLKKISIFYVLWGDVIITTIILIFIYQI